LVDLREIVCSQWDFRHINQGIQLSSQKHRAVDPGEVQGFNLPVKVPKLSRNPGITIAEDRRNTQISAAIRTSIPRTSDSLMYRGRDRP
jgi:hypothetical protein